MQLVTLLYDYNQLTINTWVKREKLYQAGMPFRMWVIHILWKTLAVIKIYRYRRKCNEDFFYIEQWMNFKIFWTKFSWKQIKSKNSLTLNKIHNMSSTNDNTVYHLTHHSLSRNGFCKVVQWPITQTGYECVSKVFIFTSRLDSFLETINQFSLHSNKICLVTFLGKFISSKHFSVFQCLKLYRSSV